MGPMASVREVHRENKAALRQQHSLHRLHVLVLPTCRVCQSRSFVFLGLRRHP